jgi:hypothetical protein
MLRYLHFLCDSIAIVETGNNRQIVSDVECCGAVLSTRCLLIRRSKLTHTPKSFERTHCGPSAV